MFPSSEPKIIGLWAEKFRQGCQICILRVQKNILGVIFFKTDRAHA